MSLLFVRLSLFVVHCRRCLLIVDCCLLSSAVVDSGGGDVKRIRTHMFKFNLISCRMCDLIRRSCVHLRFEFPFDINFGACGGVSLQVCQLENEIRFSTPLYIYISLPLPVATYKYELHSSVIQYSRRYCSTHVLKYCTRYSTAVATFVHCSTVEYIVL